MKGLLVSVFTIAFLLTVPFKAEVKTATVTQWPSSFKEELKKERIRVAFKGRFRQYTVVVTVGENDKRPFWEHKIMYTYFLKGDKHWKIIPPKNIVCYWHQPCKKTLSVRYVDFHRKKRYSIHTKIVENEPPCSPEEEKRVFKKMEVLQKD